ncbi:30S ribosomal protein S16 [Candidatus Peregrinibacteria bacterium]|nr:30S ribosomal protein S16 [Candidatus Peregrinibacteria bacterium]
MLRIRLQRSGRKNRANYRVVVAEHSAPIKGRYLELLGTFDPLVEKHGLVIDTAKLEVWIKKGAKPTNTVARLLKGQGVKGMEPFIFEMKDRKVKNPKEEPEMPAAAPVTETPAAKSEASPAPAEEKPAEEKPAEEKKEEAPAEKAEESKDEEGKPEENK